MSSGQDLAPYIREHLPSGIVVATARFLAATRSREFPDYCVGRYRGGAREHEGEPPWTEWEPRRFRVEGFEEIADSCIYPTMEIVQRLLREGA